MLPVHPGDDPLEISDPRPAGRCLKRPCRCHPAGDGAWFMRRDFLLLLVALVVLGCTEERVIKINTRPQPAAVRIDGTDVGTAPVVYPFVFSGRHPIHRVAVQRLGYQDATVVVSRNSPHNLMVDLKPLMRRVTISAAPFAAIVRIN